MTQSQQRFHDDVCKSRGMERGMSSNESKRKHLDNMTFQAEQEKKKLEQTMEARREAEKAAKVQEHELGIAKVKTASEAHKTAVVLEKQMTKVADKNLFGKKKSIECPGGTYYSVSKSDYDELQRHVRALHSEIEKILKTDFAGQEAVAKLEDMLKNEEQYILQIAAAMANERFQEMVAREERSKETEERTQQELAQATDIKNRMGDIAQQIALDALETIPSELQDEHQFVMGYLQAKNPWAYQQVQQALEQRNQKIAQEIEERTQRFHHHHRHR